MPSILRSRLLSLVVLAPAWAAGPLDEDFGRETFRDLQRFTQQPSWLGNPDAAARLSRDDGAACFQVDAPHRGMKWAAVPPPVSLADAPYLIVRYRAERLNTQRTDYLIYLNDRKPQRELAALRPSDIVADGRWHVVAVDVSALTEADTFTTMAVQVQADQSGQARLWLDWLRFAPSPPPEATVIARTAAVPPQPDWSAPLHKAQWQPEPAWLSNPADDGDHQVQSEAAATRLRVATPGRGMKWSWRMPESVSLTGHRWVSVRYRARGVQPHSDYFLAVMGPSRDGSGYARLVDSAELISDGRWHTLHVDARRVAAEVPRFDGVAVQLQAAAADAFVEISRLALVERPATSPLTDALRIAPAADWAADHAATLPANERVDIAPWLAHLRLDGWPAAPEATIENIPFRLESADRALSVTPLSRKAELRIPVSGRASEVYLLTLAALVGADEPCYGGGRLRAIRDVDRFLLRLEYDDGTVDECLPWNVGAEQFGVVAGPQVWAAPTDPSKTLRAVVLSDRTRQGAFAVAALTLRDGPPRLRAMHRSPFDSWPADGVISLADREQILARSASEGPDGAAPRWRFGLVSRLHDGSPVLTRLDHSSQPWAFLDRPCPLIRLRVDDRPIPLERLRRIVQPAAESNANAPRRYEVIDVPGLAIEIALRANNGRLVFDCTLHNGSEQPHTIDLIAPSIGPYSVSEDPAEAFYLYPKCGAALDHRPCSFRERYSGRFPVQFIDTFSPAQRRGLALMTTDTTALQRRYLFDKRDGRMTLGVEYPHRVLQPGATFRTATALLLATDGRPNRGLQAYREWLSTWYRPAVARRQWFREVFNFRQRFLWSWDPLYDASIGRLDLQRAVDEARREFGGIDYLHLFDWGNCGQWGRIYGRRGDYSPYDSLEGGQPALRAAIAGVQQQGVPVGLYIEGYLLQQRGKLGQAHGEAWQLIGRDGQGVFWPDSTEMMTCPAVQPWRDVQAATYAAKVGELDVDGMYVDQFGFANPGKDCYSREHGHPTPSDPVRAELGFTQQIRRSIEAAKPNVALYTEESPVDVTSQFQDGSFTYAMFSAQRTATAAPLNAFRFAAPDFKTIEILYCDKPTGSWATGVRWVFFNGEAIWLEGPAHEWFEPKTRACIRRCWRILHAHRDAFTTDRPRMLAPTRRPGVLANVFPTDAKTVVTLYNTHCHTVRGEMLRIDTGGDATYHDAWHDRPIQPRHVDGVDAIDLELAPHGVGCVVIRHDRMPPDRTPKG